MFSLNSFEDFFSISCSDGLLDINYLNFSPLFENRFMLHLFLKDTFLEYTIHCFLNNFQDIGSLLPHFIFSEEKFMLFLLCR